MKNTFFFLVGLLISCTLLFPYKAHAAITLTPTIAGYSAAAGRYAAPASSLAMTAANDGYIAQSVLNVGGKAITLPATLRMASNAGKYALEGMRLNPWLLAGTLALPWLLDHGMQWVNDHWEKTGSLYGVNFGGVLGSGSTPIEACKDWNAKTGGVYNDSSIGTNGDSNSGSCYWTQPYFGSVSYYLNGTQQVPATQPDWDALPDPLPAVAPELPYAPYMPDGAPVLQPDFAPADVPLGNPYTKPDGSTAQPRAKISPSGDGQVTVSTYDQPLTDAQGQPVSNPTPQPTPDPPKDPCDGHPDRAGCVDLGTPPAPDAMPSTTKQITFVPVSITADATCPAPITFNAFGKSMQIDYSPACTYASGLHPIVIAVGYLTALFIIFGAPRSAQS